MSSEPNIITPDQLLDRSETCKALDISRQTLISWIRKGKIKVWKRVGQGSNAALLFERAHVEALRHPAIVGFESKQLPSS
jgi:hypothetical protein